MHTFFSVFACLLSHLYRIQHLKAQWQENVIKRGMSRDIIFFQNRQVYNRNASKL